MNRGLYAFHGFSATAFAAEYANWLFAHAIKFHRDEMFNALAKFVQTEIKESQTVTKSSLEKSVELGIIREFNGWKLVNGDQIKPLSKVLYTITLKNQLREISPDEVR